MTDYRKFRFSKLNTPEFEHLKPIIFWPLFGLVFMIQERFLTLDYNVMHCALDDKIPFCEFFLIPYMFWFVFLVGMHLYLLLFDTKTFKQFMWFIIITYSITAVIYFVYPSMQELRPSEFLRDNVFTRFIKRFYEFDTNTNVCPSLHVVGSVAVLAASLNTPRFKTRGWRAFYIISTALICISTVFLKQHSVLDIPPALVICAAAYPVAFKVIGKKQDNITPETVGK